MNQYQNLVIKTLQYTVYTHMASLCCRPQEKLHFLDCAEKLGPGSSPPVNQVILAVFVTGEILSKSDPLFLMEHFTEKTTAVDFEYRLKLHQYCVNALDSIDNHPAFAVGKNVLMAATLKMMVSGCRSLAALQIGKHDEALAWASTTIQVVKYVDSTILPMLITTSLAYAVQAAAAMQQRDLFCMGMAKLKQFTGLYPIAVCLWNRLVSQGQGLAADATFIVPLPEHGTPAFSQYQQQIQIAAQFPATKSSVSTPGSSGSGGNIPSGGVSPSPTDTGSLSSPNFSSGGGSSPMGSTNSPSQILAGPTMFSTTYGSQFSVSGSPSASSSSPPNGAASGFDSVGLGGGYNTPTAYSYGLAPDMYQGMLPQSQQQLLHHQIQQVAAHQQLQMQQQSFQVGLNSFSIGPQSSDMMEGKSSPPDYPSYDDGVV